MARKLTVLYFAIPESGGGDDGFSGNGQSDGTGNGGTHDECRFG
jgi:hypothetical protein